MGWGTGLVYLLALLMVAAMVIIGMVTYSPYWLIAAIVGQTATGFLLLIISLMRKTNG